jgi:hypothetical protein
MNSIKLAAPWENLNRRNQSDPLAFACAILQLR